MTEFEGKRRAVRWVDGVDQASDLEGSQTLHWWAVEFGAAVVPGTSSAKTRDRGSSIAMSRQLAAPSPATPFSKSRLPASLAPIREYAVTG